MTAPTTNVALHFITNNVSSFHRSLHPTCHSLLPTQRGATTKLLSPEDVRDTTGRIKNKHVVLLLRKCTATIYVSLTCNDNVKEI